VEDLVVSDAPALEVSGLSVRFGGLHALEDVSLQVTPGEVLGLIGPNGAGKTTLFNAVSGFVRPEHGALTLDGRDLRRLTPWRRSRLGLVRTFQQGGLVTDASVTANLLMAQHGRMETGVAAGILGLAGAEEQALRERAMKSLARLGLEGIAGRRVADLSHGLQRRVEVAAALVREPKVLLLDEPSAGLDPSETAQLGTALAELQAEAGFACIVIDHDLRLVRFLAKRVVVLSFGRVIATGTWDAVRSDPAVVAAYLGPQEVEDAPARTQ
jgi:branched-chain amino acid transport system ATP-binding protein